MNGLALEFIILISLFLCLVRTIPLTEFCVDVRVCVCSMRDSHSNAKHNQLVFFAMPNREMAIDGIDETNE